MFFLGKAFEVRGKAHGEEEKPFLEHLEDLRVMITKIVLTLLVFTIFCWVFHKQLMDVLREPVHEVWDARQKELLPAGIDIDQWERIKKVQDTANLLQPELRDSYFEAFDEPELKFQAESVNYYAVALTIPDEEKREAWVNQIKGASEKHKKLVFELLKKQPPAEVDAKSKVVNMKSLKPTETFMLAFKLSFYAALVLSFPLNLYFILQFILPGLKTKERKVMWPAMALGFGLFLSGVLFAYFAVLPRALDFFFSFGTSMGVDNDWRIGHYIGFVTQFTLIFGLAFELPVLVMTLVKLGLIGYQQMSSTRSYAVLAIVVIAAAITPTSDLLTLSMLAVPMYILYEICIIWSYFDYRKQKKAEEEEYERTGVRKEPMIAAAPGAIAMSDDDDDDFDSDLSDEEISELEAHDPEEIYSEEELAEVTEEGEDDSDSYEENLKSQQEFDTYDGEGAIDFNPGASFEEESADEDEPKDKGDA